MSVSPALWSAVENLARKVKILENFYHHEEGRGTHVKLRRRGYFRKQNILKDQEHCLHSPN